MVNIGILCKPIGILKIIELAICLTCLALIRGYHIHFGGDDAQGVQDRQLTAVTTFGGMILVTFPQLLAYLLDDAGAKSMAKMEFLQCVLGAVLYLITGAFAIEVYHDLAESETRNAGIATGALSLIACVLYAISAFFAHKNNA